MAISKRLRFEILRRDRFACRYCGARPSDDRQLRVDHVVPRVLGGTDDPSNLVTACEPCNTGKASCSLDDPVVEDVAADALRWSCAMQAASSDFLADRTARVVDQEQFREWWQEWGHGEGAERRCLPLDDGWHVTVDHLIAAGLPLIALKDAIEVAMTRTNVPDANKFRYVCGIAWRQVGQLQEQARLIVSGEFALSAEIGKAIP